MPTPGLHRNNSSVAAPIPGESIWDSQTFYSEGTKHPNHQLECSSLAVKCERAFHATANVIFDSTMTNIEKNEYIQCFNKEMEAVALETLNQVRQAEYRQKHGLREGTFIPSMEEFEVVCSTVDRKKREGEEKKMLIELFGEENATDLRRKWRKEKREEKKRNKGH